MKMIRAIIQPHRLEEVREALQAMDINGMTAYQAQGFGRQKGHTEIYRGSEYSVSFRPKITIEVVVDDEHLDATCEAIVNSARTGNIGDGKVFVMNVGRAIRIRTGETGDSAL